MFCRGQVQFSGEEKLPENHENASEEMGGSFKHCIGTWKSVLSSQKYWLCKNFLPFPISLLYTMIGSSAWLGQDRREESATWIKKEGGHDPTATVRVWLMEGLS